MSGHQQKSWVLDEVRHRARVFEALGDLAGVSPEIRGRVLQGLRELGQGKAQQVLDGLDQFLIHRRVDEGRPTPNAEQFLRKFYGLFEAPAGEKR